MIRCVHLLSMSLFEISYIIFFSLDGCCCSKVIFMVQLHLNPIHAVVQLRPSLAHLKSGVSKRKDTVAAEAEVTVKVEPNDGKAAGPSAKQVITYYWDILL